MGKHGGIAKAGKVRKQTPKAAKMDRDYKFKVGRSKMRSKYNKRFFPGRSHHGQCRSH